MREPEEGLKQLIECLKPEGFMKLGLYSELARRSIVKGRELIAEYGYASDEASIRECRQRFMSGEVDREQIWRFLDSTDFYSLSNCRDLLFHVQEHRYTIPQISEMLERNGLEFAGFEGLPEKVRRSFLHEYPNKDDFWSLDNWQAFEEAHPDSFLGMYVFWSRLKK